MSKPTPTETTLQTQTPEKQQTLSEKDVNLSDEESDDNENEDFFAAWNDDSDVEDDSGDNETPPQKNVSDGQTPAVEDMQTAPPSDETEKLKKQLDEANSQILSFKNKMQEIKDTVKLFGIDNDDPVIALKSYQSGKPADEIKAQQNTEAAIIQSALEATPEYKQFQDYQTQLTNQQIYAADLTAVKQADPTIQAVKIQDIPNFDKFSEYRAKGYDTQDSYFLANRDALANRKAAAARQNAENIHSKDHLTPIRGSAASNSDDVDIPANEINFYREQFPEDTPEKLRQRYNRIQKRQS